MEMKYYATKTSDVTALEQRNADRVRKIASECMVLLENNGILPLLENKRTVALYGVGARHTIKGGTGSGDVYSRNVISIYDGLCSAGFQVTSDKWLDQYDDRLKNAQVTYQNELMRISEERGIHPVVVGFTHIFQYPPEPAIPAEDSGEIAIYVISRNSGEGRDRHYCAGDYLLTDWEKSNILLLRKQFNHLIILLNVGGIIDTFFLREESGADAILLIGQCGAMGGHSVADVLIGAVPPSGHLTDTWAKQYSDYPCADTFSHMNGNLDDEYYSESIYVGYRHFDAAGIQPAYCFGYGKSYTDFHIQTLSAELTDDTVHLQIKVTNTGCKYPGKQVVQVYCSAPKVCLPKPYQVLVAYKKTKLLTPGDFEILDISFPIMYAASFDTSSNAWCLESGLYQVRVGSSSRDTEQVFSFETGTIRSISVNDHDKKLRPFYTNNYSNIELTLDDVRSGYATIDDLVAQLSLEELVTLCVGSNPANSQNVIGSAARQVPGACGETTSILNYRHIPSILFADGPAGLRLKPHFQVEDGTHYYQYCTAIPIATTLAQSWDTDLLYECGDIVGSEMEQFHINIWLAPGMNIHRNPFCGRNFEYYSEDPLLSGFCASAETKGVQSHKGCGVALKHFACNNQEDNRMFNNVHIDHQALREIYLRGFEIAVKEARPHCIMTAYNLINGIHAANHHELLQDVLRDEWGFEGFVITDWQATQDMSHIGWTSESYSYSSSSQCISAGNDLIMPGCTENINEILLAVKSNLNICIEDLQFCAKNILQAILRITN